MPLRILRLSHASITNERQIINTTNRLFELIVAHPAAAANPDRRATFGRR
jgi:hypothetical protein